MLAMMYQFFISVLTFIFLTFLKKWLLNAPTKPKILPPSPRKIPILGNLHQLGLHPHRKLDSLAKCYGPLMMLNFGSKPVLIASSADVAQQIMKTHDLIFSNRAKASITEKLLYEGKDVTTAPYGEYWRQIRSICVLQLLSNKRVQSFQNVRKEETVILVNKIKESSTLSLPINLSEMLSTLTNDITCRIALGRKYSEGKEGRRFKELLDEFMVLLGSLTVGDFIPWLGWLNLVNGFDAKVDRVAKEFDRFLDGVVEEHIANKIGESVDREDPKDFVDVLLELQKDNMTSISRVTIKAIILDMFAAGTDTTYTVLEWVMTELLKHPCVMKQLQNEVRGIASRKSEITESDLDKMHYLKAVIKETLRLHPPFPLLVPREASQDVKINGYDIPAGTMVMINAWAIGRDPATWDQPEEFMPERFLNSSVDFRGHDFQLIPFGAGRRGCPGISFAMAANELVLANLLNRFDWALPGGGGASGDDLDMNECPGITLHKNLPLLVVATPNSD